MIRAVRAKFEEPDLRQLLISTHPMVLVQIKPDDSKWGSGKDGGGDNLLGRILMQIRDELRRESASTSTDATNHAPHDGHDASSIPQ